MTGAKKRVYEIAREVGIPNKELIAKEAASLSPNSLILCYSPTIFLSFFAVTVARSRLAAVINGEILFPELTFVEDTIEQTVLD